MKIRAYVNYNEYSNKRYYRDFELVDVLPAIGDIVFGDDLNLKNLIMGKARLFQRFVKHISTAKTATTFGSMIFI